MDGEETFLFLSNRRDRETNPSSSVKGSGANHYPRAPLPQQQVAHSKRIDVIFSKRRPENVLFLFESVMTSWIIE